MLWQGDISTEMYFITQGMLEVRVDMDPIEVEGAVSAALLSDSDVVTEHQ